MSGRKGTARPTGTAVGTMTSNTLMDASDADLDPVQGALRFGMDSIIKIVNDTVPFCPAGAQLKHEIAARKEAQLLQLVEAEMVYNQTATILNQVVEELGLQEDAEMEANANDFVASIDKMGELTNRRLAEYRASLTPSILKSHPMYLDFSRQLKTLMAGKNQQQEVDNADAETEAEEVELDDSVEMDEGEYQEVIPELDPITKQPLRDPVRNSVCGHIYGKVAMLEILKNNARTRCPAMGCSNMQFVKPAHLVEDPDLTARVNGESPPRLTRGGARSPRAGQSPRAKRGRRRR